MHLTQFRDVLVQAETDQRCLYRSTCLQGLFERSKTLHESVDLAIRPCTRHESLCEVPIEALGKQAVMETYLQSHVHCTREGTWCIRPSETEGHEQSFRGRVSFPENL